MVIDSAAAATTAGAPGIAVIQQEVRLTENVTYRLQ